MSSNGTSSLKDLLRPIVRRMRSAMDGALHPSRRRKAEAIVRGAAEPRAVLFICTGNICRSPYAEKAFRRDQTSRGQSEVQVASAGLLGPGRPSPEAAVRIARERGVLLHDHLSRSVDQPMLAGAGLLVAMEAQHARSVSDLLGKKPRGLLLLGDLDPTPIHRREIVDPWGHSDEVFRESFERIERCVARLGELLAEPTPGK